MGSFLFQRRLCAGFDNWLMPGSSDFRLGADVVASDGRKVGTLVRVVVEREGFDARALVVKEEESLAGRVRSDESMFVTDEVVIPIAAVESATHDLVQLSMSRPEVKSNTDRSMLFLGTFLSSFSSAEVSG